MSALPGQTDEGTLDVGAESSQRAYSEDGVDLTLIRWMLSLTPAERLRELQRQVNALRRLRDGVWRG